MDNAFVWESEQDGEILSDGIPVSRLGYPWVYLTEEDAFTGELQTGDLELLRIKPSRMDERTLERVRSVRDAFKRAAENNGGIIPSGLTNSQMLDAVREEEKQGKYGGRFKSQTRHGVTPLSAGIDTLYLTAETQFLPVVIERLELLKGYAQDRKQKPIVQIGGHRLEVQPYGAKPFWRYVLKGSTFTIKIRRDFTPGQASAYIEIRSQWLWRDGADSVVESLNKVLKGWSAGENDVGFIVSRLDICADVQSFSPSIDRYMQGCFLTRSRSHSAYLEGESSKQGAIHFSGGRLQGLSFGRGAISARIYDKVQEIKKSKKEWLKSIWRACGWDGKKSVFRVEFQLRAEGLKCWLAESGGDFKRGKTWKVIRKSIDGIWAYLTGRNQKGWLSLRTPSSDTNRARWRVDPDWAKIASLRWGKESLKRARVVRVPEKRFMKTPDWVGAVRRKEESIERMPQARASMGAAIARIVTQSDVESLCDRDTRVWTEGTVFKAAEVCMSPYLAEAEQRAEQLGAQAVGVGISLAANMDEATGALDPLTEDEAIEKILWTMRAAMKSKGDIKERLILSKDKNIFRQAFEKNLRSLTA